MPFLRRHPHSMKGSQGGGLLQARFREATRCASGFLVGSMLLLRLLQVPSRPAAVIGAPGPIHVHELTDVDRSSGFGAAARGRLVEELRGRGFAVVRCPDALGGGFWSPGGRRQAALDWLQSLAGHPAHAREVEVSSAIPPQISTRLVEAEFPRRVTRLDMTVPPPGMFAAWGDASGVVKPVAELTAALHDVAVLCLQAIARDSEAAPGLLGPTGVLAPSAEPESIGVAREPSLLRANLYPRQSPAGMDGNTGAATPAPSPGPCWHVDLGLLTVTPAGTWPALMASPFHEQVGGNAFLEELLDPSLDVLVFAGTTLSLALGGTIPALVHGVSEARLARGSSDDDADSVRVSLPYFLRGRRRAAIERPDTDAGGRLAELYPAVVEPEPAKLEGQGPGRRPVLDLLRFHRDLYGRLCTRGQVVPLAEMLQGGSGPNALARRNEVCKRLAELRV